MLYLVAVLKKSSTSDEKVLIGEPKYKVAKCEQNAARAILMGDSIYHNENPNDLEVVAIPFQVVSG